MLLHGIAISAPYLLIVRAGRACTRTNLIFSHKHINVIEHYTNLSSISISNPNYKIPPLYNSLGGASFLRMDSIGVTLMKQKYVAANKAVVNYVYQ